MDGQNRVLTRHAMILRLAVRTPTGKVWVNAAVTPFARVAALELAVRCRRRRLAAWNPTTAPQFTVPEGATAAQGTGGRAPASVSRRITPISTMSGIVARTQWLYRHRTLHPGTSRR